MDMLQNGPKMMLFFDTETTGLPGNWKAPITQTNNWPRLVQLAWLEYDDQENLLSEGNQIIKPDGYIIPNDAVAVHGITTEIAQQNGAALPSVLKEFSAIVNRSNLLISHNIDFDEKIVGAEFIRIGLELNLFNTHRLCTMKTTVDLCRIPGKYGYKWPSLSELHRFLFGSDIQDAHDAAVDVKICAKCFFELKNWGFYQLS